MRSNNILSTIWIPPVSLWGDLCFLGKGSLKKMKSDSNSSFSQLLLFHDRLKQKTLKMSVGIILKKV